VAAMEVEDFCVAMDKLGLAQPQQALAVLWFLDRAQPGAARSAGELARILRDSGLGDPHSTRLGDALSKSGHALKSGDLFRIKPTSRGTVEAWLSSILMPSPPVADQANGFVPEAVWKGTFGYIEKIAQQVNGCYEFGYYDGASVLIRKIIENLLIECYEHRKIENRLKDSNGNYPMLKQIIASAVDRNDLPLGRDTREVLKEAKPLGDWSAHTRRYVAVKADLDKFQAKLRVAIDDLLHLAGRK